MESMFMFIHTVLEENNFLFFLFSISAWIINFSNPMRNLKKRLDILYFKKFYLKIECSMFVSSREYVIQIKVFIEYIWFEHFRIL